MRQRLFYVTRGRLAESASGLMNVMVRTNQIASSAPQGVMPGSRRFGVVEAVVAVLLIAALLTTQALMGGTRLLFAFPGYGLVALAGLVSLFAFAMAKPFPDRVCLATAILFFGYVLARAAFSPVAYIARLDIYAVAAALLVYFLTARVVTDSRIRLVIVICLLAGALGHVIVGAIQFRNGANWMPISFLQRIDPSRRASGFYAHPNHLAGFLELIGILGLSVAFWSRWPVWSKLLIGYAALVCYVGVILTGSRGGYLSVLASVLVFAVLSWRIIRVTGSTLQIRIGGAAVVLALFAAMVAFAVIHKSDYLTSRTKKVADNNDIRVAFWRAGLDQWKLSPLIGTGSRTYLYYGRQFRREAVTMDPVYTHNDYLQLLAEFGLIGFILFVPFLGSHVRRGLISSRRLGPRRIALTHHVLSNAMALNVGALAALAAFVVHSFFDFNLHIPANALVVAFLFGILANSGVQHGEQDATSLWRRIPLGSFTLLLALFLAVQIWRLAPGEFYAEQARVALRDHRPVAGISFALKGLEVEKQNPQLYYYLGRARVLAGERQSSETARASFFNAALPAYQSAQQLAPLDETYWLEAAFTFDSLGRFEESEWMFSEALHLDPKSPSIRRYYQAHLDLWAGKIGPSNASPEVKEPTG